jgi:hypothetical protein
MLKKNNYKRTFLLIQIIIICHYAKSQNNNTYLTNHFSGSYENYSQYYMKDSKIDAIPPLDKFASNSFLKLDYNYGDFSAGIQYEGYLPSIIGFFPVPIENKSKLVNKYFKYTQKKFSIQVGDFYEQFGSGLIFRAYENRQIGINNALEGFNINIEPTDFLKLKIVYGKPREIFDYSKAIVRGSDAEINLISLLQVKPTENTPNLSIGGSYVSKYEEYSGPIDNFPATTSAYATRLDFSTNLISLNAEYVSKSKDPHLTNGNSNKKGNAFQFNLGLSKNNFGANINFRSLTNMEFKADRDQEFASIGPINYLPALTKQHDNLTSNIYLYNTQANGETGFQSDLFYTIKSGSKIGGKYGTTIAANFSYYGALNDSSELLSFGKRKFYSDANIEIRKKWNKKLETTLSFQNLFYNGALQVASQSNVISNIISGGVLYKFKPNKSVRLKLEHLSNSYNQDNWAAAITEISFMRPFAIFASDLYNYGKTKIHYYNIGCSLTQKSTRFSFGFGRQRAGLFCVGGICRFIPASYGFTASLTTSFAK